VVRIRLQFTQCRKEAAKSLPVLKPWQNSFMRLELSHWRCHSQLSRSCVPNFLFIQRQNNSSTILPHEIKLALPYIKQNLQATCLYVTVEFAILWSQGRVRVEYFYDLQRRNGCGAKLSRGEADAESKKWSDSYRLGPVNYAYMQPWNKVPIEIPDTE